MMDGCAIYLCSVFCMVVSATRPICCLKTRLQFNPPSICLHSGLAVLQLAGMLTTFHRPAIAEALVFLAHIRRRCLPRH